MFVVGSLVAKPDYPAAWYWMSSESLYKPARPRKTSRQIEDNVIC